MRYKIRDYHINTNDIAKAVEEAIADLNIKYPGEYDYVKFPVR
ncbi:UNVERIFIED_ORG: hypothetical protein ABIC97_004441 [Peribacillus simplex]